MKRGNEDNDLFYHEGNVKPKISHQANMLVGKYLMINFFEEVDSKKPGKRDKDIEIKAFFLNDFQNSAINEAGEYLIKRGYINQDKWNRSIKEAKEKKLIEEEFKKVSKKFREFASGNLHLQNYFQNRYKDYATRLEADKNLIADIKKKLP